MTAVSQAPSCIVNGQFVPLAEAAVSVQDRGFRYGDGVFETIAVHAGVPYRFDWHMQRLARGLNAIRMSCQLDEIKLLSRQLLEKNGVEHGLLRLQVTRGIGGRGYLPETKAQPTIVIETMAAPDIPKQAVTLWLGSYRKISPRALPVRYKLCQGLNSTLARLEAQENGCFDALLLDEEEKMCETSSGNIFWLKDKKLYTPALACGALEGSTREAMLRLSPWPVEEVEAHLDTLTQAEAVFITNVAWTALGVSQLKPDATWKSEETAEMLRRALLKDREDYSRAHHKEWLHKVA